MNLTLLIGGVRAGKSSRALDIAKCDAPNGRVLFVATAQAFDEEMRRRIDKHRAERPAHWQTLESPLDLAEELHRHLAAQPSPFEVIVIDCLTLWVSNLLLDLPDDADAERVIELRAKQLLGVLAGQRVVVVTNEVGLGVVPPTPLGRRYRDALGRVNQLFARAASDVSLLVAGLELPLKRAAPPSAS